MVFVTIGDKGRMKKYIKEARIEKGYKGKGTPLQAWTGPEGSRSLRLPDFKTVGT
jgi:hypothetical protein